MKEPTIKYGRKLSRSGSPYFFIRMDGNDLDGYCLTEHEEPGKVVEEVRTLAGQLLRAAEGLEETAGLLDVETWTIVICPDGALRSGDEY